ncbi:hypothetical protein ACSBR2_027198 [Camellia fascicularis]
MEYTFTAGGRNCRGESSRQGRGTGRGLTGGRNFERGESSRQGRGTRKGSGDAEVETPFALLDASCAYHDRFGKRHFVMPKHYRDPCGFVEDPSDNQIGYGLADAIVLKWPALFIERKEDPDNVDRLCERLRREISQMRHRSARDMKLSILKLDAKKNGTTPNGEAVKENPAFLFDPELSDCLDSEIADLSEN